MNLSTRDFPKGGLLAAGATVLPSAGSATEKCDMLIHLGDMVQNVAEKPVRELLHHSKGNYFHRSIISTINWVPPGQLEWLKATLEESPFPCIVLSHQSFERCEADGTWAVRNAPEVRAVVKSWDLTLNYG